MDIDARIDLAKADGIYRPAQVAAAARLVKLPLAVAFSLVQKESPGRDLLGKRWSGGLNIYGHDAGGALSTGMGPVTVCGETYPEDSDIPVTPANFGIFLIMISHGVRSNGVGPCQITYDGELPDGKSGGFFRQMLEEDLWPWHPPHNMQFGFRRFRGYLENTEGDVAKAGTIYNAGSLRGGVNEYGLDLELRVTSWRGKFARAGV